MNRFDHQWQKLTALARQAGDDRDAVAPYGFAVRTTARAAAAPTGPLWLIPERLALRGLMVAAAFGVGAMAFGYATMASEPADDYALTDTVGEILALT